MPPVNLRFVSDTLAESRTKQAGVGGLKRYENWHL
jgi:hypothetical protein